MWGSQVWKETQDHQRYRSMLGLTSLCWPERWTRSSAAGYTWTHWRWLHSLLQEKSPQTHAYHTCNTTETRVRLRRKGFWSIQTHCIIYTHSGEPGKTSFWASNCVIFEYGLLYRASYHLTRQWARGGKSLFMQSRSCMASGYASESRRHRSTHAEEVKGQLTRSKAKRTFLWFIPAFTICWLLFQTVMCNGELEISEVNLLTRLFPAAAGVFAL